MLAPKSKVSVADRAYTGGQVMAQGTQGYNYKALGCGLLGALAGVTRQAIHKQAQADKNDMFGGQPNVKATLDRSIRKKLDRTFPTSGDVQARAKALGLSVLASFEPILNDPNLKHKHKLTKPVDAAQDLAVLLNVKYEEGMTLLRVLAKYLGKVASEMSRALLKHGSVDKKLWSFGVLELSAKQLAALALGRKSRTKHGCWATLYDPDRDFDFGLV